jgi:hypothetical protein
MKGKGVILGITPRILPFPPVGKKEENFYSKKYTNSISWGSLALLQQNLSIHEQLLSVSGHF